MTNIKIHPKFIMSEADIQALDKLPANGPTAALTIGQKKLIEGIYYKYITKNNVLNPKLMEVYNSVMARKWPNKERMVRWAAMRTVLKQLVDLQELKQVTLYQLATMYKGSLILDEEERVLIQRVYDF